MSVLIAILAAASASSADIRPLLREQGFSGPINGRETIKYVGHIQQGRHDYQIYTYRGVFRASAVDHGRADIIVILNGSTYLGSYKVAWPTDCKVRGQSVICNTEDSTKYPGVIEFTKRGPPYEIWFDGEVLHFDFGNAVER